MVTATLRGASITRGRIAARGIVKGFVSAQFISGFVKTTSNFNPSIVPSNNVRVVLAYAAGAGHAGNAAARIHLLSGQNAGFGAEPFAARTFAGI